MPQIAKPILIAGPTASGKSGLALALAERLGGALINADALQVYADWRALSARPSDAEEARAPHFLYGHVDAARPDYSTGRWLSEALEALETCRERGLRPILVGGTGLYFKALTEGLAEIPPTPPEIRAQVDSKLEAEGLAALVADLRARDPDTAARTDLANPRRVTRALEALETTGRGLAAWAAETPPPALPLNQAIPLALAPDRTELETRIRARLARMIEDGALDEVRAARARRLSWDLPGMKPLGAAELSAHLDGAISLEEALEKIAISTRQYAKRQGAWIRNQMGAWRRLEQWDAVELATEIA